MDKTDKGSGAAPTSMTRTTSSHEQHVPCAGISRRARINRGSRNDTRAVGNHAGRAGHVGALHFLRLKEHVIGGARAPWGLGVRDELRARGCGRVGPRIKAGREERRVRVCVRVLRLGVFAFVS